ncbi:hypothetical protein [Kitasatospora sp. NPDC059599]|uniref:hypothetical protein n=1 Tax=Kitasatospora sp. NPDC059599 TaxID=3346880 RepID=UPI00369C566C
MRSEEEPTAIEDRVAAATPGPWVGWTETRQGIGGESFVRLRADAEEDDERYLTRVTAGRRVVGPDPEVDADVDFIAAARQDVPRPVVEVRRLRETSGRAHAAD